MKKAPKWIEKSTESVLRQVGIGLGIAKRTRLKAGVSQA
jgi:glycerate 2-kinase